jgi:prepilin-type N-terminal cleavage/methylation domain-containing protein
MHTRTQILENTMRRTKGFTLIELLVVMAIISLLLGILLPALNNARAKARETKDGTQIKQIHQSWVTKSLDNQQGRFPLPGEINRIGPLAGRGNEDEAKNDHASLYSACVAQNLFSPQLLVSPSEASGSVAVCSNYDYNQYNPAADTYWDGDRANPGGPTPSQHVNFTTDILQKSNTSYACMPLVPRQLNARRANRRDSQWKNSSDSAFSVMGNRGVQDGIDNGVQYTQSKTLEIHGGKNSWEGNVCFNDNHIQFERTFYPQGMACVPGGLAPPAGDLSCGTGTAAAGLGLENIFREDDVVNRTDAFMCIVSQVQTSGSGANVTATHTINWD